MTLINKIFWLAIVFECVYLSVRIGKTKNILVLEKVTELVTTALVGVRKRTKLVKWNHNIDVFW